MSGACSCARNGAGRIVYQRRVCSTTCWRTWDYYVDSLDERQLYQMAIDGMLDQLPRSLLGLPEA